MIQTFKKPQLPVFAFIDETGSTLDKNQPELGVGALVIWENHLALNAQLRNVFLEAIQDMGAVEERFEFKFTYITKRSARYYEKLINILQHANDVWGFEAAFEKRNRQPFWEHYLALLETVFTHKDGKYIVLADFLNKPRRAARGFSDVIESNPSIVNILQLESQGSVLLQVSDILLGATAYDRRGGKDTYKLHICRRVEKLLKQKVGAGIDPIYATPNTCKDNKS